MATIALEPAEYSSGPERRVKRGEAAGQTFERGAFVVMSTDGLIEECADDAVSIFGLAESDATGTTSNEISVIVAQDNTMFRMNTWHVTPSSADFAVTMLDVKWGLEVLDGRHHVDVGQNAADAFMVHRVLDAVGDRYARVEAAVLPEAQQFGATGT